MLSWSNAKYKLTLGIGSLAVAGMLAELWRDVFPVWAALTIALLPLVVFVFVHPGGLPARLVRIAHIAASVWYVVVAVGLLVALTDRPASAPRVAGVSLVRSGGRSAVRHRPASGGSRQVSAARHHRGHRRRTSGCRWTKQVVEKSRPNKRATADVAGLYAILC